MLLFKIVSRRLTHDIRKANLAFLSPKPNVFD
jgi:hypothetical protein